MAEKKTGSDARGGPMRIVYAVILIGIVAIVVGALLTGRGPHNDRAEEPAPSPTATAPATTPAN